MSEGDELGRLQDRVRELEALLSNAQAADAELRKERDEFLDSLDRSPYAVVAVSRGGATLYANRQFTAVTGYTIEDIPNGRAFLRKAFPNQRYRHAALSQLRMSYRGRTGTVLSTLCKDGSTKEVEFRPTVFGDRRFILVAFDVTDRKRWEDAIRHMAYHDALTDLPNRTLLNELLQEALFAAKKEQIRLGIMLIDLDNLKETNDHYGHPAGDLILKTVASRIRELLRATDTVARIGGDEFVVLLPSIHRREDVVQIAEKIVASFAVPVYHRNQPLTMGASIGIALYPKDGEDPETLIARADKAMYAAKGKAGKRYSAAG